MAEISESTEPAIKDGVDVSDFDPKTMRTTKPGLKRLYLTISVLFSFLLGLPFLWKSVEIYRSPLPFRDIDSLSTQIESNPLQFPCRFQAIFVGFSNLNPSDLHLSILDQIHKLNLHPPQCGTCSNNFTLSVSVDPDSRIGGIDFSSDDDAVDEALETALPDGSFLGGKLYSVLVVDGIGETEGVRDVVGKYRHAWILGKGLETEAITVRVAEIFVKVFVNGGREEGMILGEFMPVGADGKIILSFNLLNADPRDWVYDWDFQTIDEILMSPVVEALNPIANISVESQVLYHTPKASFSYWDDKWNSYIFSTKDLPFFVNSNEWHLDTSIASGGRSKVLHIAVYIPSADESPLLLQLPNGDISKTNSFISPMWGGVIVWNPQDYSNDSESMLPDRHKMSLQDLQKIFEVFMGQFRQLFGLKSDSLYVGPSGKYTVLACDRGFSEWELDVLSRQHTCFNLRSSATTLGSLSRLVQSLPRMIIMDEIGKQVKFSLEAAKLAQSNASLGAYHASAVSSRQARSLAEDAFFHPSIMSVSYYSFEHCFAVYSPFFLPVSMHVLLAAVKEWKRYKQEKRKYLAWQAKQRLHLKNSPLSGEGMERETGN